MRVAVLQEDRTVKIEEHPTPKPKDNEILLKVLCAGQNPSDLRQADFHSKPGVFLGADFVGEVVELGAAVPRDQVKKGEIRCNFVLGCVGNIGAFGEYVTTDWDLAAIVPSNVTPQQAATLPLNLITAVQAFYLQSRLGLPEPPVQTPSNEWVLVWSGATAVGSFAIQLAKLSGFKVATTASPNRWELLKSYGADVLVDYKDPDVVRKLKEATGDRIQYGLDCISEGDSYRQAQRAFCPEGGRLITTLFPLTDLPRPEVKTDPTFVYTTLGEDFTWRGIHFKTSVDHRQLHARWAKKITQLLAEGKLRPLNVEIVGGLDDIPRGLDIMRAKKHKDRLVYNISK